MRYFVYKFSFFLLLLFVTSTSAGPKPVKNLTKSDAKHDRRSIYSWFTGRADLKCGEYYHRVVPALSGKTRLVGGSPVHTGQFPYVVRLIIDDRGEKKVCGGVIISDRYVLTVAHCVQRMDNGVLRNYNLEGIMIGDYSIRDGGDGQRFLKLEQIIPHPEYNDTTTDNDIALLKTMKEMEFNLAKRWKGYGAVNSVCLPSRGVVYHTDFSIKEKWVIAGWGKDEHWKTPETLLTYQAHLVDYSYCKSWLPNIAHHFNPDHKICTFNNRTQRIHLGDSGSGLVRILDDDRYELVGLASHGPNPVYMHHVPKGIAGPDQYTNVYHYMDWIKSNIYQGWFG